jgi:hypothetical protein
MHQFESLDPVGFDAEVAEKLLTGIYSVRIIRHVWAEMS